MPQCRGITATGSPCQLTHACVSTAMMRIASAPLRDGHQYCMYHLGQRGAAHHPVASARPIAVEASPARVLTLPHVAYTPIRVQYGDAGGIGGTVVQCEGITIRGVRCRVSSDSSEENWEQISRPLREGGRFCTLHKYQAAEGRKWVAAFPASAPVLGQQNWQLTAEHIVDGDVSCICPLCFLLCRKVVQIVACGHNFCHNCVAELRAAGHGDCPVCRTKIDQICPDAKVERQICATRVRCAREGDDSCTWVGRADEHEQHRCVGQVLMMPQTQAAGKTKKEKETSTNKTNPKAAVKAQAKVPKKVAKKFK